MEETHIKAHAEAFAGLTIEEYYEIVNEYKATQAYGYSGMTRGEAFYLPMMELWIICWRTTLLFISAVEPIVLRSAALLTV